MAPLPPPLRRGRSGAGPSALVGRGVLDKACCSAEHPRGACGGGDSVFACRCSAGPGAGAGAAGGALSSQSPGSPLWLCPSGVLSGLPTPSSRVPAVGNKPRLAPLPPRTAPWTGPEPAPAAWAFRKEHRVREVRALGTGALPLWELTFHTGFGARTYVTYPGAPDPRSPWPTHSPQSHG